MGEASTAGRRSGKDTTQARQTPETAATIARDVGASMPASIAGSADGRWYDLLVIMDDATSEIYYAQLVEEESTPTVFAVCGR